MGRVTPPSPHIHTFDLAAYEKSPGFALQSLLANITSIKSPRLVLDIIDSTLGDKFRGGPHDMHSWAEDSMSSWGDGVVAKSFYLPLPETTVDMFDQPSENYDLCKTFLNPIIGNRSCFDKCS